jgi:hypothetical protein
MDDELIEAFTQGVNDYWAGKAPAHWDKPALRDRSPYLQGWYMASMTETSEGFICAEINPHLDDFEEE